MTPIDTKYFLHRVLNIELGDFLLHVGLQDPEEQKGILCFPSPFSEKGLLKVDTRLNSFDDDALGIKNGNILQFGQAYYHCRVPKLLNIISEGYQFTNEETRHPDQVYLEKTNYKDDIRIISINGNIERKKQQQVLESLNIPFPLGKQFVSGIDFLHRGVEKQGIVFLNNSGGCEIYDGVQKLRFGSSDVRTINNGSKVIDVFERFEDLLALKNMQGTSTTPVNNVVVLNNIHAFENARDFMEKHEQINLYLRHNEISREYVGYSQWLDASRYKDFAASYSKDTSLATKNIKDAFRNRKGNKKGLKP